MKVQKQNKKDFDVLLEESRINFWTCIITLVVWLLAILLYTKIIGQ